MITFLRRIIGSKIGAGVGLLFLVLLGFFMVSGDVLSNRTSGPVSLFGDGSSTRIGSKSLPEAEVQKRVQRVFEQQRRDNPGMQIGDFLSLDAVPNIYDQLVAALSLSEFARKQGMHVSKRMVDAQIASIPAFHDATGKFSQSAFRQLLAAQNVSEQALRYDIQSELTGRLLVAPTGLGTRVSENMALPYASLLLEAREGRIAAIPSTAFKPGAAPNDKQLQDFYARNAERYAIPEQRKLRYALVDAERFATAATPTDAEIGRYYTDNKPRYAAREVRAINRLILPTESAAKAAAGAASLAEAARANGLSVASFKDQSKDYFAQQNSAAAADMAFAAPQGKIVGPVKLSLGWALIETTAIQKIAEKPLAAVKPEIVTALTGVKRKALLGDLVSKIEDSIANGSTFDEAVKDNGLKVEGTPALLATGQNVQDESYRPSPEVAALIRSGFAMEADDDAQFVPLMADERYALLDVTDIIAPAPPPLAKVKPLITRDYLMHEGAAKARTLAERIKAQMAKGTTLEKALADAGVPLPPAQKVGGKRADLLRQENRPPAEISILFAMATGTVKIMPIPNEQGYFVITLDKIMQGDAAKVPGLVERVRGDIANVVANEYGDQFGRAVQRELGVKRNTAAIARVTAELRRINGVSTQ